MANIRVLALGAIGLEDGVCAVLVEVVAGVGLVGLTGEPDINGLCLLSKIVNVVGAVASGVRDVEVLSHVAR